MSAAFTPLLSKEDRRKLSHWLTIVPDLGQFVEEGIVLWTPELIDSILRVTDLSSPNTATRLIMAAPTLSPEQVFTDEFYNSLEQWFNRPANETAELRIVHGHDGERFHNRTLGGSDHPRNLAIVYTTEQFRNRTTHPYSRMWKSIMTRQLPPNSTISPTGWSCKRSDDDNPSLGDWIDRGEIALNQAPHENDSTVLRKVVIIQRDGECTHATVHSMLPQS